MIDSSIDIGVKKIVYVKHWLRSFSLLFFSIVVYLYLFVIICMLPCHDGEIKLYIYIDVLLGWLWEVSEVEWEWAILGVIPWRNAEGSSLHWWSCPRHDGSAGLPASIVNFTDKLIDWLIEFRFYVPLDTELVISETFFQPVSWLGTKETIFNTTKASNTGIKWCMLIQETYGMLNLNKSTKTKSKAEPTCKFKNCSTT